MCLHVVLGSMYRGHVSACSACCIRCVGHILIGLDLWLLSVYMIHVCVSVSACGVSV